MFQQFDLADPDDRPGVVGRKMFCWLKDDYENPKVGGSLTGWAHTVTEC